MILFFDRFCLGITALHVVIPAPWLRKCVSGILNTDPISITGQGGNDFGYFLTVFQISYASTIPPMPHNHSHI